MPGSFCRALAIVELIRLHTMSAETGSPVADQDIDSLAGEVERLKAKLAAESSSRSKLEAKKEELMDEIKRTRRVSRLLEGAGISLDDDDAEAKIASALAVKPSTESPADSSAGSAPSQQPVADPLLKSEIAKLTKQLETVQRKAEEAERREQEALKKQREDKIERLVVDHLAKSGCRRPAHVFKLKKGEFFLSDDGSTVLSGPDYDPKTLTDVVESLKEDEEWDLYFNGSGATGSGVGTRGTQTGGGTVLTGRNPFCTDSINRTEAAAMFEREPEKAKRMMAEARSAGKLDPTLGKFLA